MAFLPFGVKIELVKEYSFQEIPIFSSLSPSEQKLIEKKARLVEFKRGDNVYQEGTVSEAFYVVISGRFRLFTKSKANSVEDTLIYFHRGDHFGETSLLTGSLHSGTVEAKRDGVILRLEKDDFLHLMKDIPAISLHLSRSLGHRLTRSEEAAKRREVKVAALYGVSHPPKVTPFWMDFAARIYKETRRKVVLADFYSTKESSGSADIPHAALLPFDLKTKEPSKEGELKASFYEHPKGFSYLQVQADEVFEKYDKKLSNLITTLTYRFDYILLRLPSSLDHPSFKSLKQSDGVYVYAHSDVHEISESAVALAEFQKNYGFGKTELKTLVVETEGDKDPLSFEAKEGMLGTRIFSIVPSLERHSERYAGTLKFLAKELAGTLVGLALGSGAAFGLAHIGVLKVLEKEGIPIDVISGSSIGAFIGAFWAAGYTAAQLEELAISLDKRNAFTKLIGFRDFSLAHRGFFKGHQIVRFMESYFEGRTFQDLKLPLKVVATNFYTSEAMVLESGLVSEAVRASISIPAIFRPVLHRKQYLIDGGVADPLPIRILNTMGVRKIIAVNVLAGPKDLYERNRLREEARRLWLEALEKKNWASRMLSQLLRKVYNRYAVNVFNMIMNSIQFMEYELADSWGNQADVLIHPIVPDGHWAEFYNGEKFIRMGELRTREQLAEIRHLLVE